MKKTTLSLIALFRGTGGRQGSRLRAPWWHYFAGVSGIEAEKVEALRNALAQGTWNPSSKEIAARLLRDHLTFSYSPSPPLLKQRRQDRDPDS
jgi:hypothetical protein